MASLASIHQSGAICPRTVVRLTPCNLEDPDSVIPIHIRSHDDIHIPGQTLDHSFLSNESITSQQVDFQTANSSISTFNFSVLEHDNEFSKWMQQQAGCTLRGALVEVFIGDESLPFSKYELQTTQQLRSVQHHQCEHRYAASGIVRTVTSEIFPETNFPLFGAVFDARNDLSPTTDDTICDSQVWRVLDENGNPIGPLTLATSEKFYSDSRTGDYYLKVDHEDGCEVMRASSVVEEAAGRLQPGDTVEGLICVQNTGTLPIFNLSVTNATYDIYDNPAVGLILPGDTACVWRWRATDITKAEAEAELAGFGTTIVTYNSTLDGTPVTESRSTASPEFYNELGPLPSVTATQEGLHVEVQQLWVIPDGQITCGTEGSDSRQERDRVLVPIRRYNVVERGMFGTPVCVQDESGVIFRDGTDIAAAVVIEGTVPEVLYQVMTGRHLDDDSFVYTHEDLTTQPEYSAKIDPRWINKNSFSQERVPELWSLNLRFICPPTDDPVDFWELEILRWSSYFLREDPDGRLSLAPLNQAGDPNAVIGTIGADAIFSTTQMTEDWQTPTELIVAWDFDPCEQQYRASAAITNEDAVADNCGIRDGEYCAFQGVRSDVTSAPVIRNHMREWLAFRAVPRGKGCMNVCMEEALKYRVGDTVRFESIDHTDRFNQLKSVPPKGVTLSRPIGISSIRYEHRNGQAQICYEMPLKLPYGTGDIEFNTQPCATTEDYCQNRRRLEDVLPIVNGVVQGDINELPIDDYCYEGDLTLRGTILPFYQRTGRTFGLAVSGRLTLASDLIIRGNAQGFPGYTVDDTLDPIFEPGMGSNTGGSGGNHIYFVDLTPDQQDINTDPPIADDAVDTTENEADPDVQFRRRIANIGPGQDPRDDFDPITPVIDLPESPIIRYRRCEIEAPMVVRGRPFGYENPATPLQMTAWELAGNGGAGGGTQQFIGPGTVTPLRGGRGGAGGMGLAIVAHDVIVQDGVVIDLSGGKGQESPDNPMLFLDRWFGGIRGIGGNAGRAIIVLDGASTQFLPQPVDFISQRTGARSDLLHPDSNPVPIGPPVRYCGEQPMESRFEADATLYRNLTC